MVVYVNDILKNYTQKRWCHSFVQNFPVCLTHSSQLPGRPCSHRCCLFDIFFSWHFPADSSRAGLTVLLAVPPNASLLLSQDLCTCCSSTRMFFPRYPQRSFSYFFLFFLILTALGLHCYWVFSLVAGSRDCSRVVVCGLLTAVASFAEEFELSVCGLQQLWFLGSGAHRASLLRGTWDLPGSGIGLTSPALTGRFFTTEPPGKTLIFLFTFFFFFFGCVVCGILVRSGITPRPPQWDCQVLITGPPGNSLLFSCFNQMSAHITSVREDSPGYFIYNHIFHTQMLSTYPALFFSKHFCLADVYCLLVYCVSSLIRM